MLLQHKNCKTCVEDSLAKKKIANFINLLSNSLTQSFGLDESFVDEGCADEWDTNVFRFPRFCGFLRAPLKKRLFGHDV